MRNRWHQLRGLVIAALVIVTWLGSLVGLLSLPLASLPVWLWPLGTAWMTFLYTGLFITAHDAIHGTLWRRHRRFNTWIGRIVMAVYALLPYDRLRAKHFQHHKTPGRLQDPDYHGEGDSRFVPWYLHFMRNYVTVGQLVGMAAVFNGLLYWVGVPPANLILFWAGPALLSTVQLFAFGTYLPHREPDGGYTNRHHACSNDYPVWLSFLTCYHFGYHLEHHQYPNVPWWQLPRKRQQAQREAASL
jgi:beta-carotene ketolase (CrtW type)